MATPTEHRLISYLPDGRVITVRVVVSGYSVWVRGVGIDGEAVEAFTLDGPPPGLLPMEKPDAS